MEQSTNKLPQQEMEPRMFCQEVTNISFDDNPFPTIPELRDINPKDDNAVADLDHAMTKASKSVAATIGRLPRERRKRTAKAALQRMSEMEASALRALEMQERQSADM